MSDHPATLEMRGIRKEFFGTPVLKDVDLVLRSGEIHALLGENGAGKSTLMNILFGMPVIHETGGFSGEVFMEGRPVRVGSPREAMNLGVGMVHQEFMLLPGFTVAENIKLNREPLKGSFVGRVTRGRLDVVDRGRMGRDSRRSLDQVGIGLDEWTPVAGLPVGHMQFVEIAREVDKTAGAAGMKVLVFDEPTAVLAESEAETLLDVMRGLAGQGVAILFITHRLDEVMRLADTVTILRDGELVACTPTCETSIEDIAERMVGRQIEELALGGGEADEDAPPLLTVRDLHVDMPGEKVKGVDLDLRRGEILGIGGLAGQGKLGIANGLMGLFPAEGEVRLDGRPLPLNSPRAALRSGLAFVSEDRRGVGLLLDESVEMNIAIPAIEVLGRFLFARLLGPFAPVNGRAVRTHANSAIENLDIRTTGPGQIVRRLSGGNQQKVCLARALVLEPRLLLVSEPTRGIDVGAKMLVLDWLRRLNRDEGLTILMTSSELGELRSICHRVAIVSGGRIAGVLAPDDPDVRYGLLMGGEAA